MNQAYMNWSGGKDSALCLYKARISGQYDIRYLLTSVNKVHNRVSMHGVRRSLLALQSAAIGIPLHTIELPEQPDMFEYEQYMMEAVRMLRDAGCSQALFGDIFLEDLRKYREQQLAQAEITAIFPLWKMDTGIIVKEFIELGFRAVIVCVNEQYLDRSFCGRLIDESFINDLPQGVDPCGENGEFHSFVFDGPIFNHPVPFAKGELIYRNYTAPKTIDDVSGHVAEAKSYGFYFLDLI